MLVSQLKKDSVAIRGAVGETDVSLVHFSTTQTKIKEFFDRYNDETEKIAQAGLNDDKMPSPYSSAQGTYVETVFDKIMTSTQVDAEMDDNTKK